MTQGSPFLVGIALREDRRQPGVFPFEIPILRDGLSLELTAPVTFLVGENGSGKSTLRAETFHNFSSYRITREVLESPERYFRHLIDESEGGREGGE